MTVIEKVGLESPMREVLAAFPGAQRALFRRYHIGGCSSYFQKSGNFQPDFDCPKNGFHL